MNACCEKTGSSPHVAVMGMWNWLETGAELLRRAGIAHEIVDLRSKRDLAKWVLRGRWRRFDFVYHILGVTWRHALACRLLRKPVLWHWCGSDTLFLRRSSGWRGKINRLGAYKWAAGHVVDSPELAEELRGMGIEAEVVRLLPRHIEADVEPLPQRCTVLSYWSDGQRDFYKGDVIMKLAEEFPQHEFRILMATGRGEHAPPNVKFLGYRTDMPQVYSEATVLIRLPEHDSLSAMVLEMLARGRYVIYNKQLEGCHYAEDFVEARRALEEISRLHEPNVSGARMVKERFSLDREAAKLAEVLHSLNR